MKKLYLFFLLFVAYQASAANINVSGTISTNTTWSYDTVKVTGDITIANGVYLSITAGTYIEFQGHYKINVQGRIIASGSANDRIVFTAKTQSVGWGGIRYDNTPSTNYYSYFTYCTFSYGKADQGSVSDKSGGAVFMNNFSKVKFRNCIFSNNYASYYGGAIALEANASPLISNCLIVNNSSGSTGGGIDIYNNSNPNLINNTIAYNSSSNGGGLWTYNYTGTILNCIIYGNSASSSPQIYGTVQNISYCVVEGGYTNGTAIYDTIPEFVSPASGAGNAYDGLSANYSLASTSYLIDRGSNQAMNFGGLNFDVEGNFRYDNKIADIGAYEKIVSTEVCGAITSNTTWSGSILMNCSVTVSSGVTLTIQPGTEIIATKPVYLKINGRLLAQGTKDDFITMTAWDHDEGWYGIIFPSVATTNDTSKIEYCKISYKRYYYGSTASQYNTGAIYVYNTSKLLIRNNKLSNNYGRYGGAIYLNNSSAKIVGNLIVNNQAYYGAGIYINGSSSSYSPQITNNTIALNKLMSTSNTSGSGVYKTGSANPSFLNNIIYGNTDNSGNHALANNIYPTSGLNITYSCVHGGYTGTGNISSNPKFKNTPASTGIGYNIDNFNFSLQPTSPCIDAGSASTSGLSLPAYDLAGKTRNYSTHIDMGAYEDKSSLSVCGTISSDQTWDANVININCDVTINSGVTVTVVPGTKVQFNGHYKLTVNGALHAIGAQGDTIIFTAANTTNGWDGIEVTGSYNSSDSVIFDYCKFEYAKRTPTSYYYKGGAISVKYGYLLRITNSTFTDNSATGGYGGGAAFSVMYGAQNVKIKHNLIKNNTGEYGIVYLQYIKPFFEYNTIVDNTTNYSGIYGVTVTVNYCNGDISNNLIANNSAYGGALYIFRDNNGYIPNVYNNIIANNSGTFCGGLQVYDSKPELYNNTIVNNTVSSTTYAGGILFRSNGDAILKSNIVYGNTNSSGSSQVYLYDVTSDPKFYNNDVQGGESSFSGPGAGVNYTGVYSNNIDATPGFTSPSTGAGISFRGDMADWSLTQGSSLINAGFDNSASMFQNQVDYAGNTRIYNGRIDMGAYENQQPITVCGTISDDTEWEADTIRVTCPITVSSTKKLTIKKGTVVLFTGYYGIDVQGAIEAIGTPDDKIVFTVIDTTGIYDSVTTNGGWDGITFNSVLPINDSSKFDYCVFKYAKAPNYSGSAYDERKGAAMFIYNSPKISIEHSLFANNRANYHGGAIYLESSNIKFNNNIVANNSSGFYGGGIYLDDFSGEFMNNTIVNNKGRYGGGVYTRASDFVMRNCIVYGNSSFYSSSSYYSQLYFYSSTACKILNSDIQYGKNSIYGGTQLSAYQDNIVDDPEFQSPSGGRGADFDGISANWNVSSSSPVLNGGTYASVTGGYDYTGNRRVVADTVDMGAYEIQLSRRFIDLQPANTQICEGASGSFATHATVNASYQWQKDGLNIPGATSKILSKSSVALADTGLYNCIISNAYGSISTDTVELTVLTSPTITSSPTSTSECLGSSVTFTAGADGSEPISYQWYNTNGALGSGASNQTFEIGQDSVTNTSIGYPSPFANYFWGNKEQYLILASELTAAGISAGDISSLAFDVDALNSCPTLSNFEIKIGSTSANALSTSSWIGNLTTVYSAASYQVTTGWNNFGFTSAFTWDGTSNIVVEVCSNNSSWINNGNASVNQSSTTFYSSHYYHQDNTTTICSSTSAGYIIKQRPNFKLTGASASSGTSSYTINSITANDASSYYMIATNTCGFAQSNGATLGIKYSPALTPISATDDICEDGSYTYSTTTSQGTTPITYQWFKDGSAVSGATALTYNITNADTSDAGIYYCKATNTCGSDSTNQSILVVNEKPQITSQSSSQTVCENQSVTLGITATGTGPLTYQWYKGSSAISGATNNTYTISSVSTSDAGTYYCKVSNGCVSTPISSTGIVLTVNTAPSVSSQTGTVDVCAGSAAPFSVTATGTAPLTYQWYNSSGSITSATNNTYTISSASTSDAGNYYCVITNGCGSATSNIIPLTVNSSPSVTAQPSSLTKCEGQSALLSIQTSGTSPITYQWYKGGSAVTGATNSSFLISPVSTSDAASYYCVATNSCGTATSSSATLTVNTGVSISSQSSSTTVCEGSSPTFQITAAGTAPITYQWYGDNGSISGATSSSYSITSVDTSDAGNYYCVVTNGCSSTNSNSILLTVNESPTINTQPSSATVCENLSAVFNVSASGTAPLTYQWYDGNGAITGATNASYIIPQVSTSNSGSYYVKVTNTCGNIQSNTATLTVNSNVSISSQTSSKTVCDGASPTFSITATGSSPISYQWYKDGSSISSATNNTLNLSQVDTSDAGSYYVIVSNTCNNVQSNAMQLTVNESPSITTQPVSATTCGGSSAMLSVTATGTAPLTYQWYKGSSAISGATSANYLISSVTSSDAGSYYSVVSNSCGSQTSNNATLSVNSPVVITSQTGDSTKCAGQSMTFAVTATGTSPSYQWYYNGTAITGGTSASYTISSVTTANAGDYYCIVSNSCNSVQSSTKTLTVNSAPTVTQQSSNSTVCDGSSLTLSVSATGSTPLSYQWYKGSTALTGAVSSSYPMYQIAASDAGVYKCVVSNSCGSVNSANINVTVHQSPVITAQSSSATVCKNSSASLSVTATGTPTITYQWYNSSGSITGAQSSTYTINSVDTSDAGTYYCVATNTCGTATSNNITLVVNQAPAIVAQSGNAVECVGSSHSFSVSATGTAPMSYQWYNGNGAISGATNSLYLINSVDTADAGSYYCIVTNGCGNATSTSKTLSVKTAPNITSQSTSATKCEGSSMLFTVTATGSTPLSYQWYADTGAVAGANANSYSISSVTTANAGNYYCQVSNVCGSATSTTKTLTVHTAPDITSQTSSDTLCEGQSMVFNVSTTGTSPITYQWYKNNQAITGATNNIYMIASIDTTDAATYKAVATNSCGSDQSANIMLTVNKLAQITYQSGDSTRCEGESMTFSVQANGTAPLSYQWYKSGTLIQGATTPVYALSNVNTGDNGYYHCVIANSCNTTTTSNKVLTVHTNPQPQLGNDTTFCLGGSVTLTPGYGYNCIWNNGSFNNQLNVTQSGSYWVNVTDQYGCSGISDTVNVNVILPYSGQQLCMAGVDSATQKNVIVWEKVPNVGAASYNIYRESATTGVWTLIQNRPYDSLSVVFDMTSNPAAHAERYAITVVDSCGNESALSQPHKTMHLAVSPAVPSGYNLTWNGYQGFTPASYRIWKADTSMKWKLVDSVNANIYMWHDTTTLQQPFWYQIEVLRPGGACNPTKANTNYNTSRSNMANNGLVAPSSLSPDFIATPTQGKAPLVVKFYDQTTGGTPSSWFWNFGDGNTSTQQDPAHQYDSVGVYDVTLTVINTDGVKSITKFGFIDVVPDGVYVLDNASDVQVFPNPYSGKTNIVYTLMNNAKVRAEVYSSMGKLVAVLADEEQSAGEHKYEFSAKEHGFSAGVYYLRMIIDDSLTVIKMVEVK